MDIDSSDFFWGYEVMYQQYIRNLPRDHRTRVKKVKLWLVNTTHTANERMQLGELLKILRTFGIIRKHGSQKTPNETDAQDIITDFFVKLLQHVQIELMKLHGYSDEFPVEFAMTVPAAWTPCASRVLQAALQAAARAVGFGTTSQNTPITPYIISEPEAAATYMLADNSDVLVSPLPV